MTELVELKQLGASMRDSHIVRVATVLAAVLLTSCTSENLVTGGTQKIITNPVSYFEIPVSDMDRAIEFYQVVFTTSLERTVIDGNEMALFPFDELGGGVSGALAKGKSYSPSRSGPRIYFFVENIDETLNRAVAKGGRIAYPKTSVGNFWVAEFEDSEGNQIALSSASE